MSRWLFFLIGMTTSIVASNSAAFSPQADFKAAFRICTSDESRMAKRVEEFLELGWRDVTDEKTVRNAFLGPLLGHWMLHNGRSKTALERIDIAQESIDALLLRDFAHPEKQRILLSPRRVQRDQMVSVALQEWNPKPQGHIARSLKADHTQCQIVSWFHPDFPDVMALATHEEKLYGGHYVRLNLASSMQMIADEAGRQQKLFYWHRIDYYSASDFLSFGGLAVVPFSYVRTMTTLRDEETRSAFADRLVDDPRSTK